jgi:hypothetical protein
VTACGFAVGFLTAWLVLMFAKAPMPWIFPAEGKVVIATAVEGVAVDFYGRMAYCALAGAIAAAIARAVNARKPAMWLAWIAGLLFFSIAVTAIGLYGRVPVPAPLPSGYAPR